MLDVRELCVEYRGGIRAVDALGFRVEPGEAVGLLGESGCGKSTTALALLGLLPPRTRLEGSIRFDGRELVGARERDLEEIRGAGIALISQEPATALNPVLRAGDQVAEVARAHRRLTSRQARQAAAAMLEAVGFDDPARIYAAYPHQLSGGQRQRIVIAQALVAKPQLLVADEPTTLLDARTQAEVLGLIAALKAQLGFALLLISHDPEVLAGVCGRLLVMYGGSIVESGPAAEVCGDPLHPYTLALLGCARPPERAGPLPVIPGEAPDPALRPPGCRFEPRCARRKDVCRMFAPQPTATGGARAVSCFLYGG